MRRDAEGLRKILLMEADQIARWTGDAIIARDDQEGPALDCADFDRGHIQPDRARQRHAEILVFCGACKPRNWGLKDVAGWLARRWQGDLTIDHQHRQLGLRACQ